MNTKLIGALLVVSLLLGGYGAYKSMQSPSPITQVVEKQVGATPSPDQYTYSQYYSGLGASKYQTLFSVNASTTSSTAPTLPLALSKSSHGIITVGTSTPAVRTTYASTTAVTANSTVWLQQTTSGPTGVTCNTTGATSTISAIFASTTNISLNGFSATLGSIPTTNPVCLEYWVVDRSTSGY